MNTWWVYGFDEEKAVLVPGSGSTSKEENYPYVAYPAYSVAELGEMLPSSMRFPFANGRLRQIKQHLHIFRGWDEKSWMVNYTAAGTRRLETIKAETEADARAKMLIHLIEHNLVDVKTL